jgi:hypothetical protein
VESGSRKENASKIKSWSLIGLIETDETPADVKKAAV